MIGVGDYGWIKDEGKWIRVKVLEIEEDSSRTLVAQIGKVRYFVVSYADVKERRKWAQII